MVAARRAGLDEADWLGAGFDAFMGWTKPPGYFADALAAQAAGDLMLLVAADGDAYVGHCKVVWQSDYAGFRERGIPEIQDLNVRPDYRRRGIGGRLLDEAERLISQRSDWAGIGFGLYADYGAAQRLYIQRGYLPDGRGVAYGGAAVTPGQHYAVDDNLVLYLTRQLRLSTPSQ